MVKFFGLGGLSPANYLKLVINNDWEEQDQDMVERETDEKGSDLPATPDDRKWQYKRGVERFWTGDALRAAGHDVTFEDSRRLWRAGWVSALRELIEARGGSIKCP